MTLEIIQQLLLGGLLGLVGQGIRTIVGLKKINDEATSSERQFKDVFVPSTLLVSLLIGFCAGVAAMASISDFKTDFLATETKKTILGLLAAGYTGTDFIEGFIKKNTPQ